jgi:hypothetical protein
MKTRVAVLGLIAFLATTAQSHSVSSARTFLLEIPAGEVAIETTGDVKIAVQASVSIRREAQSIVVGGPATVRVDFSGEFSLHLKGARDQAVDMVTETPTAQRIRLTGALIKMQGDQSTFSIQQANSIQKL